MKITQSHIENSNADLKKNHTESFDFLSNQLSNKGVDVNLYPARLVPSEF